MAVLKMAWAVAAALVCLSPAHANDAPAALTAVVDRVVRPLLGEYQVPGIAVGVTVDGRQYFFNYGVTSKEKNTPVSKDTLFEIGSISKTFAGTLASYAVQRGQLSLDDHPGKYMPALQGSALDKATVLNIATYTAGGLPLQYGGKVSDLASATTYFRDWKPTAEPGTIRQYSNPSLGLLGHVTALAMKTDYAQLMERDIFARLGLKHTYISVPEAAMADYSWGHTKANKPTRMNPGIFAGPTYGVKTSAADLLRFIDINIRPDALDPLMRRIVEGTHVGYFKTGDMVQGLGWERYDYPITLDGLLAGNSEQMIWKPNPATRLEPAQTATGPALFNKTGSTTGFGAYAAFVPARKIGIVILANKNFPIPARVTAAHAVLEQLDKEAKR